MERFAFELSAQGDTYYIDAETGQVISDPSGYRVVKFGSQGTSAGSSEGETTPDKSTPDTPAPVTPQQILQERSGSGNVMSRNDNAGTNNKLSYVHGERRNIGLAQLEETRATKAAKWGAGAAVGSVAKGAFGTAGFALGGIPGAIAGMAIGGIAGKKVGNAIIDDMRVNPQTLAIPSRRNIALAKMGYPEAPATPTYTAPVTAVERAAYTPPSIPTATPTAAPRRNPALNMTAPSLAAFRRETPVSTNVVNNGKYSVNWGNINPDELDPYTRDKVEQAQKRVDFSINVISGYRSPQHNASVQGAKGSQHVHGAAVDISLAGLDDKQRSSLVGALGSVAEPGRGRIGAYTGNTGLHFDTARHTTKTNYGIHAMFDKTQNNMNRAPGWFTEGLKGINRTPVEEDPISETQPNYPQTSAYTTPAEYTSSGQYSRSQAERDKMGFTIAGELSGKTLQGLRTGDPTARAELANVVATMENRAHSVRAENLDDVLTPSQYNSLTKGALKTTTQNWNEYGPDITAAMNDYYAGNNKPTTPNATHYANYDVVTPSWDKAAVNKQVVGDHTFSTVNYPGTQKMEYAPDLGFTNQAQKAIDTAITETKPSITDYKSPFSTAQEEKKEEDKTSAFSANPTGMVGASSSNNSGGFMGSSRNFGGGFISAGIGGPTYHDASGKRVADPWGGLRSTTSTGGNGRSPSKEAQDAARSGKGGLF